MTSPNSEIVRRREALMKRIQRDPSEMKPDEFRDTLDAIGELVAVIEEERRRLRLDRPC